MSATRRQKACIACADSKRKCDKGFPECQRCLDRDVDCRYPQPQRRRRDPVTGSRTVESLPIPQNHGKDDVLGDTFDLVDWDAIGTAELDATLSDVLVPYIPTPSIPVASLSTQGLALDTGSISGLSCPWFLRDETWVMHSNTHEPACVTALQLEAFIDVVEQMLQSWVQNGSNSFIHRRLYEKSMPTCVQDAFTTLSAYLNRSTVMKETILQIAEERTSSLISQSPPTASGAEGIAAHLARVQALFIYVFIRLFDGSVRMRASAERQIPTLRRWVVWMWESVRRYRGDDALPDHSPLQWTTSAFEREYDTCSKMWQSWILTESVRRTHLVIDTVTNIYEIMTRGWAECAGAPMLTVRRGLWEAESAVQWFDMSCGKSPLLVPSLQPKPVIAEYAADEVDDFARMYWRFLVGSDMIQCWVDRSSKIDKS